MKMEPRMDTNGHESNLKIEVHAVFGCALAFKDNYIRSMYESQRGIL